MAYEQEKQKPLEDNDLMPTGKYKGKPMINVPAKYLIYILESDMCNARVQEYIKRNEDAIRQEAARQGD